MRIDGGFIRAYISSICMQNWRTRRAASWLSNTIAGGSILRIEALHLDAVHETHRDRLVEPVSIGRLAQQPAALQTRCARSIRSQGICKELKACVAVGWYCQNGSIADVSMLRGLNDSPRAGELVSSQVSTPCLSPQAVHGVLGSPASSCTTTHTAVNAVKGPGVDCT